MHGLHQVFVVRKGSGVNRPLNQLQGQRVTLLGTVVSISSRSFSSRSVKQWPRSSWLVICRKVSRLQLERKRRQGAGHRTHDGEQRFGMSLLGLEEMVKHREVAVHGVEEPGVGDIR